MSSATSLDRRPPTTPDTLRRALADDLITLAQHLRKKSRKDPAGPPPTPSTTTLDGASTDHRDTPPPPSPRPHRDLSTSPHTTSCARPRRPVDASAIPRLRGPAVRPHALRHHPPQRPTDHPNTPDHQPPQKPTGDPATSPGTTSCDGLEAPSASSATTLSRGPDILGGAARRALTPPSRESQSPFDQPRHDTTSRQGPRKRPRRAPPLPRRKSLRRLALPSTEVSTDPPRAPRQPLSGTCMGRRRPAGTPIRSPPADMPGGPSAELRWMS